EAVAAPGEVPPPRGGFEKPEIVERGEPEGVGGAPHAPAAGGRAVGHRPPGAGLPARGEKAARPGGGGSEAERAAPQAVAPGTRGASRPRDASRSPQSRARPRPRLATWCSPQIRGQND